ncbi:MAG: thermonuclease family protein [Deltaproteobacteria bacterium]|nr:thermonuclease family protein [Deltaproteobacteria bacterium]
MENIQDYSSLLSEICNLYENTLLKNETVHSTEKKEAYWQMGRLISEQILIQTKSGKPKYGRQIMSKLCKDMTRKYGKGFSLRSIHYMKHFADEYKRSQINRTLTWSHYCILFTIKNLDDRKKFEQLAITQNLNKRELQQQVALYLQNNSDNPNDFPLTPRKAAPNIVKVIKDSKDAPAMLDLGFGVTIEADTPSLKKYPHGTYLSRQQNSKYKQIECTSSERYCYKGTVLQAVDGDTVKMRITLAPKIQITQRFRLRGVDAMELNTEAGVAAQKALTKMLKKQKEITVYTYGNDKYGRYIADLESNDIYINKQLIKTGHARYISMTAE